MTDKTHDAQSELDYVSLCAMLPHGVAWGSRLTPKLMRQIVAKSAQPAESKIAAPDFVEVPPAPCQYSNDAASAWQNGWEAGHTAALAAPPGDYVLVPTDLNSILNMGWKYLDTARSVEPDREWIFSPHGFLTAIKSSRAMIEAATKVRVFPKSAALKDALNEFKAATKEQP